MGVREFAGPSVTQPAEHLPSVQEALGAIAGCKVQKRTEQMRSCGSFSNNLETPERPPGSLSHNPVIPEKLTEHVVQLLPVLPLLPRAVHPFTDDLIRGVLSAVGAEQGVAGSKCNITDRGSLITLNKGFLGWPAT